MPADKMLCVLCGDGSGGGGRTAFEEMCVDCQEGKCSLCTFDLDCDDDDRCSQCLSASDDAAYERLLDERRARERGTW